jgi:hypothetical protein
MLKVVAADARKILQAVQDVKAAAQREKKVQRERTEAERQQVEILSDKVDSPFEVMTEAAEGDLTKDVEIEGDKELEELATTIKEMLEEVSKRNRADTRYHAAMPDSLTRGWSREPPVCLIPSEEGGSRTEPGRKRTDCFRDGVGGEGNGRNV